MHIFGIKAPFFLLDTLSTFNAIIGFDLLTQAAKIRYGNATEQLKFFDCPNVNFTNVEEIVVPNSVKADFRKMILKGSKVFSNSNEALPLNTSVTARTRTESNEPVYSKLYSYPMLAAEFVNKEIKHLLKDGIIRPSRSQFNSSAWVADKKGSEADGTKNKTTGNRFQETE